MNTPDSELRRLTDAWHDGTITPAEGLRLEERLRDDEQARRYFFETAEIEATLPETAADILAPPAESSPRRSRTLWRMAAAFAGGLFAGALLWSALGARHETVAESVPPSQWSASVTGILDVEWLGDNHDRSLTIRKDAPKTGIQSGLLELTFARGTRVLLEGPAEFRVMDDNALWLDRGKLVADVPEGAEGFTVFYANGEIIDLGTEFGLEVDPGGYAANFGVYRGEIEYRPHGDAGRAVRLLENHALRTAGNTLESVPFDRSVFTRHLPSREYAWEIVGAARLDTTWDFDVSHLIHAPGTFRAIAKRITGGRLLSIGRAELLLDGQPVAEDRHPGQVAEFEQTHDNIYRLHVPAEAYRRGHWVLRFHVGSPAGIGSTVSIAPTPSPLTIGADPEGNNGFIGRMARVSLFTVPLADSEIQILAATPRHDPVTPQVGLLAAWRFNGLSGGVVPNEAGDSFPLTPAGDLRFVDDEGARVMRLGGHGLLRTPDHPQLDLLGGFTLEAWIAPDALPDGGGRIIDKGIVNTSLGYVLDTFPGNHPRSNIKAGILQHDSPLPTGEWVHIASTADPASGSHRLYINGALVEQSLLLTEGSIFFDRSAPATQAGYIGTWEYLYSGKTYHRSFLPDGSATLSCDGSDYPVFSDSRWHLEGDTLVLDVRKSNAPDSPRVRERHTLGANGELIFLDRPYPNARRIDEAP